MGDDGTKRPGRPVGYELSDEAKDRIRLSRVGKSHSTETRNKISMSLIKYFRKKDPVSNGIENEYKNFPSEARRWICDHKWEIDNTEGIMANKRIAYLSQQEVCYGSEIESFCHYATPEFFLILKEELHGNTEYIDELESLI